MCDNTRLQAAVLSSLLCSLNTVETRLDMLNVEKFYVVYVQINPNTQVSHTVFSLFTTNLTGCELKSIFFIFREMYCRKGGAELVI